MQTIWNHAKKNENMTTPASSGISHVLCDSPLSSAAWIWLSEPRAGHGTSGLNGWIHDLHLSPRLEVAETNIRSPSLSCWRGQNKWLEHSFHIISYHFYSFLTISSRFFQRYHLVCVVFGQTLRSEQVRSVRTGSTAHQPGLPAGRSIRNVGLGPTMGRSFSPTYKAVLPWRGRGCEWIWVCLKIVYPDTQWLMISIPTKWL